MPVAVPDKSKGSKRWSSIFGKGKKIPEQHESKVEGMSTDVKHALHNLPGEEGVSGAGANEERDPIQNPAGLGFSVNQPQAPHINNAQSTTSQVAFDNETKPAAAAPAAAAAATGEGSRAASVRRRSDEEIQVVNSGNVNEEDDEKEDIDDVGSTKRIEFYRKDAPFFWLSNSSEHPIYLDGVRYPTAEHLFQSFKFIGNRPDVVNKIRKASLPTDAVKEARKNIADVRKGWISQAGNVAAMREVLLLKFSQHSALRRQLLLTGDSELVEASPTDAFWGSGSAEGFGPGRNELGKALVRTRETIRAQSGLGIGSGAKTV